MPFSEFAGSSVEIHYLSGSSSRIHGQICFNQRAKRGVCGAYGTNHGIKNHLFKVLVSMFIVHMVIQKENMTVVQVHVFLLNSV